MKTLLVTLSVFSLPFLGIAQHAGHDHTKHADDSKKKEHAQAKKPEAAIAVIEPTEGNDTRGYVLFEQTEDGIRVSGKIENLTPGAHGFHVHQYGDLRKADGTSAAGHFNPKGQPHGAPGDRVRHVGDLGNIEADENGTAEFSFVDKALRFKGPGSIIGRGLIVHAGEDDLHSQPTGDAGGRVGMAVIGVANPEL